MGSYSIVYAVVNGLWCIIFVEYWKRQELDLSCRWQTKGVSAVQTKRRTFRPEKEVRDDSTGEVRGVFPATKRMQRQLLQVPFALLVAIALGAIIATCFAIEIFISELYNGPFKSYLVRPLLGRVLRVANDCYSRSSFPRFSSRLWFQR